MVSRDAVKYLFEASALLNLVRSAGRRAIPLLKGNAVLTLTLFEVGNALWKDSALTKKIDPEEAEATLRAVRGAMRLMAVVEPADAITVLRTASRIGITFYDASYAVAALERGLTFVTDDEKLKRKLEGATEYFAGTFGRRLEIVETASLLSS
jgi:predicted nucleic acid-binding protein